MRLAIFLFVVLAISGCSFFQPTSELRVTEYNGSYLTAGVAGCRVVGEKEPVGCVKVKTEHCSYQSVSCGKE